MSDYEPLVGDVVLVGRTESLGTVVDTSYDGGNEWVDVRHRDPWMITAEKISDLTPAPVAVGDTVRNWRGYTGATRYLVIADSAERGAWVRIGLLPDGTHPGLPRAHLVKVVPSLVGDVVAPTDGFPRWPDGELVKPGDVVHALSPRREGTVVESRALLGDRPRALVKWENGERRWPDLDILRRGPLPPEDVTVSFSIPASLLAQVVDQYKAATSGTVPKLPHLQLIGRALDSLSSVDAEKAGWSTW